MSFFFGRKQKTKPQYTGLQLQTSSSTQVITLLWGGNRLSMNIFWYDDFTAHKQKQKAGKGMGGSSTYYTYSASIQGGLCEGPINSVGVVFKDDEKTTLAALGMTLFTGTYPQAPWGYLTSKHPTKALNYEGVAYVAIANYDLGQSASLGNHTFEVFGLNYNTAPKGHDADCAVIIKDFLTNPQYGAGFGLQRLDEDQLFSGPDASTSGDDHYQTYCKAMGFGLSPALSEPTNAGDILARWAMLTNSAVVWNGYKLKIVPYAREEVSGNGVKYVPPQLAAPSYFLSDNDWLEDPQADREDQSQCPNIVSIEINNRFNEYNELPVEYRDQALIDQFGERKANSITATEVTDPEMAAEMVSLIASRSAYVRNTWDIRLPQEFVLLEPMDTLVLNLATGNQVLVQIESIEEDESGAFKINAEEIANGIGGLGGFNDPATSTPVIYNSGEPASPINPPILFEPNSSLASGAEVWAAVSGGDGATVDPKWGGCQVYISTDNVTYQNIGVIDSPARMGKLTAILPTYAGANPDTTNTLKVNLSMSGGELQSVTSTEASTGSTLAYVDGELISYQDALLTAANQYDLTTLYRGMSSSPIGAHALGSNFARLDENIFKYALPPEYIGKTLYLKFASFNIWGGGIQDLSDCVAYTYTTQGTGYGSGSGGKPSTPTGLSTSNGAQSAQLTWSANPPVDNVTGYNVYRAAGTGQPFSSAVKVASISALNYRDSSLAVSTGYTYFLTAVNAIGESAPTAGSDVTTTAGVSSFDGLEVLDDGTSVLTTAKKLNFFGGGVASITAPDSESVDIEIEGGGGGGGGGSVNPAVTLATMRPLSQFTQVNITGTRSIVESPGKALTVIESSPSAGIKVAGLTKAVPSTTPYRVAVYIQTNVNSRRFFGWAAGWTDGTKLHLVTDPGSGGIEMMNMNTATSRSSTGILANSKSDGFRSTGFWLGMRDDGTNVYFEVSEDGVNFSTYFFIAKSSGWLGASGYTNIFVGIYTEAYDVSGANFPHSITIRTWDENGLGRSFSGDGRIWPGNVIAEYTCAGGETSIDFPDIPQTFADLGLSFMGTASASSDLFIRMNGDSGNNYLTEISYSIGNAASAFTTGPVGQIFAGQLRGTSTPANSAASGMVDIPNYASNIFHKSCNSVTGLRTNTGTTAQQLTTVHGNWLNTAAITRLTLLPSSGTFAAGTKVVLYGIGGPGGQTIYNKPWYWKPPKASEFTDSVGTVVPVKSDDPDVGLLISMGTPAAGDATRAILKPVPAGDFDLIMRHSLTSFAANYGGGGLVLTNAAKTRAVNFGLQTNANVQMVIGNFNLPTGATGNPFVANAYTTGPDMWLRVQRVGTNLSYLFSSDGKNWTPLLTTTEISWLTGGLGLIGLGGFYNRTIFPIQFSVDHWSGI